MDGEHIEMMIHGWASSELREKAIVELGRMREELYVLRQFAHGMNDMNPDYADDLKEKISQLTEEQFAAFWRWITLAYIAKCKER